MLHEVTPDPNWEEEWAKLLEDPDFLEFLQLCYSFRFYVNLIFIALPWWAFSATLEIGLIVVNAWLNKGWAEGNFYLIFNTLVGGF